MQPPESGSQSPPSKDNEVEIQAAAYSGPIPPPGMLADFEQASPGITKEIVGMAHKEQDHRHGMEQQALQAEIAYRKRAQVLNLSIALATIVGAVLVAIFSDVPAVAWILGGTGIVTGIFGLLRDVVRGSSQSG